MASLHRQINSVADLQSVVRTMRALAASSIGQYAQSVRALTDYDRTVQLGLRACLRGAATSALQPRRPVSAVTRTVNALVFGSDQGLVGRFNEAVADHAIAALAELPAAPQVWAVGERVHARLVDAGMSPVGRFEVPTSVEGITPLVAQILVQTQSRGRHSADSELRLYYNSPVQGAGHASVSQQLLPLNEDWRRAHAERPWPGQNLPQVIGGGETLGALIREFLFVSLFRACAESLASENASRLAAMERADRNIDELLGTLRGDFHRLRQNGIDEELFEVLAGFEALSRR